MALVKGFAPALSGQQPEDSSGNPVRVGVWGDSSTGGGVFGTSGTLPPGTTIPIDPPAGVEGHCVDGPGVVGRSVNDSGGGAGPAVLGESDVAVGVRGVSGSTDALVGLTYGDGYGLNALHFSTQDGGGVLGVRVLTVDHPTDPKNKYLSHSFVESQEMLNVYSGTVTTNRDGTARVKLPAYFEALNRDFRYQLTVIGRFAQAMVSQEIKDNQFAIRTNPGRVKVCWQVTGVRKDAWAEAHRIEAEVRKPKAERGRYLHPELFGKKAAAIHPARTIRMPDALPEDLRDRAEKLLSDRHAAGSEGSRDLRAPLGQVKRLFGERADAGRSRLQEQWRAVQKTVGGMRAPQRRR